VSAAAITPATVKDIPVSSEKNVDVDQELAEWNALRKAKKRSFREPWRSLAIASTVGFGLSSWLLPDSVADIAQFVTVGLCGASIFAGWRGAKPSAEVSD
jgi:hypothetical protein